MWFVWKHMSRCNHRVVVRLVLSSQKITIMQKGVTISELKYKPAVGPVPTEHHVESKLQSAPNRSRHLIFRFFQNFKNIFGVFECIKTIEMDQKQCLDMV